jgi:hypothetical protein
VPEHKKESLSPKLFVIDFAFLSGFSYSFFFFTYMPDLLERLKTRLDFLFQFISRRRATVVSAIVLASLYSFIQKINSPPKRLQHLPTLSLFQFYKHALRNDLFETYSRDAVMPLLKENGIYVVCR